MLKKNLVLLVLCLLCCGLMLFAACAAEEPAAVPDEGEAVEGGDVVYDNVTIKIAYTTNENHPDNVSMKMFKENIEEKSGGAITVDLYPNGVLGSDAETVDQLRQGTLDAAFPSVAFLQSFDEAAMVSELPFLFEDINVAKMAYQGEFGKAYSANFIEPLDIHLLGYGCAGIRHFTNNIRPIYEPADMAGINFRCTSSVMRVRMFEALNAAAVPISFNELFTALQQGVVDGQENPLVDIYGSKFYEVQKYLSLSGHIFTPEILVFSNSIWNSYSPDTQILIEECMKEALEYQWELSIDADANILADLEATGIEVNTVNVDAFREALAPVWDEYTEEYGSEMVDLARSVI